MYEKSESTIVARGSVIISCAAAMAEREPWWKPLSTPMKLGATYNVFDGEELLEASIKSIKKNVDYVVVVYQTISNFGFECDPGLVPLLTRLQADGLVNQLIAYVPRRFNAREKKELVSARATGAELGGARVDQVADTFFNELSKREIGRRACLREGCTHFMSMDTDEFYVEKELYRLKQLVSERGYEGILAKMRYFYKYPTCELLPHDDVNHVPVMYACRADMPFRLGSPYPYLIDPTRRVDGCRLLHVCERKDLEMFHYSFVRSNIQSKLVNVSNRGNYRENLQEFVESFMSWRPSDPIRHPHPYFKELFQKTEIVPNWFHIDIGKDFRYSPFARRF